MIEAVAAMSPARPSRSSFLDDELAACVDNGAPRARSGMVMTSLRFILAALG
jgi:hypothetical protein